jgi:hypothetical protein
MWSRLVAAPAPAHIFSPYVQENTNCVITQNVTHINLQKFLLFVLYIPLEFGQWLRIIHESDQAIEENYRVSHCALALLYTSQTDPMLAPYNTVQTPKSSLVPQGKDPSRAGIGKSKTEWLHSMNHGVDPAFHASHLLYRIVDCSTLCNSLQLHTVLIQFVAFSCVYSWPLSL